MIPTSLQIWMGEEKQLDGIYWGYGADRFFTQ